MDREDDRTGGRTFNDVVTREEGEEEEGAADRISRRLSDIDAHIPHPYSTRILDRYRSMVGGMQEDDRDRERCLPPPPFCTDECFPESRCDIMATGRAFGMSSVVLSDLEAGTPILVGEGWDVASNVVQDDVVWEIFVREPGGCTQMYTTMRALMACSSLHNVDTACVGGSENWGEFQLGISSDTCVRFPCGH